MRHKLIPLLGLIILHICGVLSLEVASGSGDIQDAEDTLTTTGSGSLTSVTLKPRKTTVILPDDEDEAKSILISEGSGSIPSTTEQPEEVEGSGVEPDPVFPITKDVVLSAKTRCRSYYCWCVDENGMEVLGTLNYTKLESRRQFALTCDSLRPSSPAPLLTATLKEDMNVAVSSQTTTEPAQEPDIIIDETQPVLDTTAYQVRLETVKTTMRTTETTKATVTEPTQPRTRRPVTSEPVLSTKSPFIVDPSVNDYTTKVDNPDTTKKTDQTDSDHDRLEGDDDVDRERATPEGALFTHPGILAAIIGGGVVALLSALLLVMFIVYRMRKKDEGSYPLDPDSKPPRLNTYTRAPNKEFYA